MGDWAFPIDDFACSPQADPCTRCLGVRNLFSIRTRDILNEVSRCGEFSKRRPQSLET